MTDLRSTIASRVSGTTAYMAPELVINKEEAATKSDVWSVACTVAEMFQEEPVWDMGDTSELEQRFIDKDVPTIIAVPDQLKSVLLRCFSYASVDRPHVMQILNVLYEKA